MRALLRSWSRPVRATQVASVARRMVALDRAIAAAARAAAAKAARMFTTAALAAGAGRCRGVPQQSTEQFASIFVRSAAKNARLWWCYVEAFRGRAGEKAAHY